MSTIGDICSDAALEIGALQLGEPLTAAESATILRSWQQLIDSVGLDRSNIHTVRQDTYPLIPGQATYTLGLDPNATALTISAATNAATAVLTLSAAHGITTGQTSSVVIQNGAGNWQAINGSFIATAISSTTLSIPVNSSSFGALTGVPSPSLQVGGSWNSVRPVEITNMNLVFSSGVLTPVSPMDYEQYSNIGYLNVSSPPLKFYNDQNAPLATVYLYPMPDQAYSVVVYSLQALEAVTNLSTTVAFAQGYERYWVTTLAIEIAPKFGLEPSPTLMANQAKAEANVKSRNRKSLPLVSDPALIKKSGTLYNYRLGMSV